MIGITPAQQASFGISYFPGANLIEAPIPIGSRFHTYESDWSGKNNGVPASLFDDLADKSAAE